MSQWVIGLVEPAARVEARVALRAGVGRAARVDAGVAVAGRLAVVGQAVVGGEHQRAVLARVEELHAVHAGSRRSRGCRRRARRRGGRSSCAARSRRRGRPSAPRPSSASIGRAVARRDAARRRSPCRPASAPEPSICRLQRMQAPRLGMPCGSGRPVGRGGRVLARAERAADHGHEALGVRAVELVRVGRRRPRRCRTSVRYCSHCGGNDGDGARLRLGVDAGHDHHAVVVVRGAHGRLDLVVAAAPEELAG